MSDQNQVHTLEVLNFLSAELMEEVFAQLTVISKLENDENSDTSAEKSQPTISAWETGLEMVADLINHFMKFKHEMDSVMAL